MRKGFFTVGLSNFCSIGGRFLAVASVFLCVQTAPVFAFTDTQACVNMLKDEIRPIAQERSERFLGKVGPETARCRGGEKAVKNRDYPWVDWSNYWATGDDSSKRDGAEASTALGKHIKPNGRGVDGSLLDLEYQRIELIKFNLFDNYTFPSYIKGRDDAQGPALKQWPEMRLSKNHSQYEAVGGSDVAQLCRGELIRYRTLTGICNDIYNPKMGSTGTYFSRNVEFDSTFPRLTKNPLARARHSDAENGLRIGLLEPDPQLISRKLFTRSIDSPTDTCNKGMGFDGHSPMAQCDYLKAPFFNVLAAFWIQFMTHDWFSHVDEGRNEKKLVPVGCETREAIRLGCRPQDRMEPSLYAQTTEPKTFSHEGKEYLERAYKTTSNHVTAWWDASQIYGFDEKSVRRALRDPKDSAKLLQKDGYLPVFPECDRQRGDCLIQPQWRGQEAAAFADNWNIGLSFYHNLFVREHNTFVDAFREMQKQYPASDSGLRDPKDPQRIITYDQVDDEILYQAARLVVSAEIAKIHTIEWTTQLLYNDPLYKAMNANWFGLFETEESRVSKALKTVLQTDESFLGSSSSKVTGWLGRSSDSKKANSLYSVLASGAGIFGLGNTIEKGFLWWKRDVWDLTNPEHINGGINHFGSPFNFPEEFTSVYRLHPLLPDLIEYRENENPNKIKLKIPVVDTIRGQATAHMHNRGLDNWALSMGRQRLGLLHLKNHPHFLQNLDMSHLNTPTNKLDIVALDVIRDRERGVPRFNEFRRQIGLKTLTSFDDFVDRRLLKGSPERKAQEQVVTEIREIYGTHICDENKIISYAQKDDQGKFINDCLGHPHGTRVDNIEDLDTVVGWLAEYTRPHGYAISETQFHIFIINASRRLFSDRFFTSSFRPEFYSRLGYDWVLNNGPLSGCPYPLESTAGGGQVCNEPELINGHKMQVSPLKRLLIRNIPQLRDELMQVANAFDPWARDRGEYYSLEWKPRADAKSDPAF